MRYRPTAAELLDAVAELLEEKVLPAVPESLRHQVRVAGNLCRILEREARLEPAALARERELLSGLLGHDGSVPELRAELSERLLSGREDAGDDGFGRRVWEVLAAVARDDLAVAKPGHDGWEGQ